MKFGESVTYSKMKMPIVLVMSVDDVYVAENNGRKTSFKSTKPVSFILTGFVSFNLTVYSDFGTIRKLSNAIIT